MGCHLHRALFVSIALLAVVAHFNAMTTDPGAVPPDATPLPDIVELDSLIKGEAQASSPSAREGRPDADVGGGVGER